MPSRKGAALSEFHQSVHRATSTKCFNEKFQNLCQKSDRHGMIKILMDIDQVKKLRIDESYHEKDDNEARKIYEKYRIIARDNGKRGIFVRASFLTKALFAANTEDTLFKEILLERAKFWYSVEAFARCLKDCNYLIIIMTQQATDLKDSELSRNDEIKIECTELRMRCGDSSKRSNKILQKSGQKIVQSIVVLPRMDGKTNGKLTSCGDSVTVSWDKTRGRHLVSTRNIKIGSVVIIDKPFSFSTDFQALATNCLHCHVSLDLEENIRIPCYNCQTVAYCSNDCRQTSWLKYHRYECTIFDYFYETNVRDIDLAREHRSHLLLAWRTTIERAIDKTKNCLNEDFLNNQETMSNEEKGNREVDLTIDPYDPLDYRTVFALETHCPDSSSIVNLARSLRSIFFAKCLNLILSKNQSTSIVATDTRKSLLVAVGMLRHMQSVDCNAYEIVENTRDETTRIWEPRNVGGAIYTTVSLVNHACYPNVVRHSYPGGKVVVRALRFLPKGTEILDCYGPHFVSDSGPSRRRYLHDKYHFICNCEACANDYQLPQDTPIIYKCSACGTSIDESSSRCAKCNRTIDMKKLQVQLDKSVKKRAIAIGKMFEGNYVDALPILLEHATLIDKILATPSLEAIKTQQSIVQCYNSLSSVYPSIRSYN